MNINIYTLKSQLNQKLEMSVKITKQVNSFKLESDYDQYLLDIIRSFQNRFYDNYYIFY